MPINRNASQPQFLHIKAHLRGHADSQETGRFRSGRASLGDMPDWMNQPVIRDGISKAISTATFTVKNFCWSFLDGNDS